MAPLLSLISLRGTQGLSTARVGTNRSMGLVHLPQNLVVDFGRQSIHHLIFHLLVLGLLFNDSDEAVDRFPLQVGVVVFYFLFEDEESALGGVIELGGSAEGVQEEIDEDLLDFNVAGGCEFLNETMHPDFCMIFLQ